MNVHLCFLFSFKKKNDLNLKRNQIEYFMTAVKEIKFFKMFNMTVRGFLRTLKVREERKILLMGIQTKFIIGSII